MGTGRLIALPAARIPRRNRTHVVHRQPATGVSASSRCRGPGTPDTGRSPIIAGRSPESRSIRRCLIARGSGDLLGGEITSYLRATPGPRPISSACRPAPAWVSGHGKHQAAYKVNNFVMVAPACRTSTTREPWPMKGNICVYPPQRSGVDGPVGPRHHRRQL
jgi:hypothetical protein